MNFWKGLAFDLYGAISYFESPFPNALPLAVLLSADDFWNLGSILANCDK